MIGYKVIVYNVERFYDLNSYGDLSVSKLLICILNYLETDVVKLQLCGKESSTRQTLDVDSIERLVANLEYIFILNRY